MSQDIFVTIEHLRGKVYEISYIMLAAARKLAEITGGQVVAVVLGHNAQAMIAGLNADKALYADHELLAEFNPAAYQKILSDVVKDNQPRAIFFGHTTMGTDTAGGISTQLDLPLVSAVRSIEADGKLVSQICGGKIMAECELPEPTALITMVPGGYKPEDGQSSQTPATTSIPVQLGDDVRVKFIKYIEPETSDIDISKEPLLISVGRGIQNQDNISLADELAEVMGGVVCASRPVVDQGWLPTSRLVGKSGSTVKPKIYLAIGISGAPEHVEAITSSNVIIAINTDPNAPIFNIAKYGTTADLFDLVPALTEQIRNLKG
jgi:electron transfer flavoprotein alpha subunit